MTVSELIAVLQKMPPNAAVAYQCCSDYSWLEEREVCLVTAEQSRAVVEKYKDQEYLPSYEHAFMFRGGRCCNAYPLKQFPPGESPVYIDVVTFPGN